VILLIVLIGCSKPVEKFKNAEKLQHAGQYRAALEQYAQLLEKVPADDPEVVSLIQLRMGECLWTLNRPREAYAALEESLRNNAQNTTARLRLAELLLAGADTSGAMEQANLVLKHDPQNVTALSTLGAALIDSGNQARARLVLIRILELDRSQVNSALTLAELYAREGQIDEAERILRDVGSHAGHDPRPWLAIARLEEIVGDVASADGSYRKAVDVEDSTETELRLAQFLAREAQIKDAEEVLRKLGSRDPESSVSLPDFDLAAGRPASAAAEYGRILGASTLLPRGQVRSSLSRGSVAARLIETELQLAVQQQRTDNAASLATLTGAKAHLQQFHSYFDPATAAALAAEVSLASENLTAAEQLAQQAILLSPRSAPAHYVLGLIRQRGGLHDVARAEWQSALQAAPGFVPARLALATQALDTGEATAAEEIVSSVVRDEPANFQALCLYAKALIALGREEQAAMIARRAAAANPSSAEPHEIMGTIAVHQRNLGKALVEYEQALLAEPHSQSATQKLAEVYRKGTISRALLSGIERTAENPPRSAVLMEIAGRLYADRGWRSDAERCLRLALQWDPRKTSAATALAQLYLASGNPQAADALLNNEVGFGPSSEQESRDSSTVENYERSLRQGDSTGAAANNLAWLYAERGTNLDRALALALRAEMLAPRNPAVQDTLGVVHLKRHEYSKAVKALEKALMLTEVSPVSNATLLEFRQHLAEAYMHSGQTQAATALERQ
jgi:tetratricopeptide (TPR) repeat protein